MDDLARMLLEAFISGGMLFLGIFLGSRMSARAIKKEFADMIEKSETVKLLKNFLLFATDQKLVEKVTKFFEEATELVGTPEAKNFFANLTKLLQQLSGESEPIIKIPQKPNS